MAVTFNESSVWAEVLTPGVERQRLLTAARVPGTKILLDRVKLAAGASIRLEVAAGDLAWVQMLEGDALLTHGPAKVALSGTHVVFLRSEFSGTLATRAGAAFLHGQVPNAFQLDADRAEQPPQFRVVDWAREPVLDSEHDPRRRIHIVTPQLFGTRAIEGELVIYPPGTGISNHYHVGAEHFMYVLSGRGTAGVGAKSIALRKGDLVHYPEREAHHLKSEGCEDLVLVDFFVPGVYETVWAEGAAVRIWTPTGRNIRGDEPVRGIAGRSPAATSLDV